MAKSSPKPTALADEHRAAGGRMVDFGGWDLPVQYTGLKDEHLACRNHAGLFDVSHMGEIRIEGEDAEALVDYAMTNNMKTLKVNQARYTAMCNIDGGIVDDLVIYRRKPDQFFIVANAANVEKDYNHLKKVAQKYLESHPNADFEAGNESSKFTQLALQGREAEAILQPLVDIDLSSIKYYWFDEGKLLGKIPAMISRTGYPGEDGFELYMGWDKGPEVWRALLEAGADKGLKPCGLGARDTLRLEARLALYGHELTEETNPIEAGLGWVVKSKKGDFFGRDALLPIIEKGPERKLVGFEMKEKGIPRQGYAIVTEDGKELGVVTSGTQSPTLDRAIGIGYVQSASAEIGTSIWIDVRGRKIKAQVVETPFYKRPY